MKRATVVVAGTNRGPQDVVIQPGTTSHDVLTQLGLEGYMLSPKSGSTYFGSDKNLYPNIVEGELLYATSEAEVGVF